MGSAYCIHAGWTIWQKNTYMARLTYFIKWKNSHKQPWLSFNAKTTLVLTWFITKIDHLLSIHTVLIYFLDIYGSSSLVITKLWMRKCCARLFVFRRVYNIEPSLRSSDVTMGVAACHATADLKFRLLKMMDTRVARGACEKVAQDVAQPIFN
jgi:hypothetical protein